MKFILNFSLSKDEWIYDLYKIYLEFTKEYWKHWILNFPFLESFIPNSKNFDIGLELSQSTPKNFNLLLFEKNFLENVDILFFKELIQSITRSRFDIDFSQISADLPKGFNKFYSNPIFKNDAVSIQKIIENLLLEKKIEIESEFFTLNPEIISLYYDFHIKHPPRILFSSNKFTLSGVKIDSPKNYEDNQSSKKKSQISESILQINRRLKGQYFTDKKLCHYMLENEFFIPFQSLLTEIEEIIQNLNLDDNQTNNGKNFSIIAQNLEKLMDIRFIDPACGAGIFLREGFRYLLDKRKRIESIFHSLENFEDDFPLNVNKLKIFSNSVKNDQNWFLYLSQNVIYGIDIDYVAIFVCKAFLWLEFSKFNFQGKIPLNIIFPNIRQGDSLISPIFSIQQSVSPNFLNIYKKNINFCSFSELLESLTEYESQNLKKISDQYNQNDIITYFSKINPFYEQYRHKIKNLTNKYTMLLIENTNLNESYIEEGLLSPLGWILEFPSLFQYSEKIQKFVQKSNFIVFITNPPWEMHQRNDREFYFHLDVNIRKLPRIKMHNKFKELSRRYGWIRNTYEILQDVIKIKQNFWNKFLKYQRVRKYNLYKIFLELSFYLINNHPLETDSVSNNRLIRGCSIITPAGILGEARANPLRAFIIENRRIKRITQLYSSNKIFPSIVQGQPLCIIEYNANTPQNKFEYIGAIRDSDSLKPDIKTIEISLDFLLKSSPCFNYTRMSHSKSYSFPLIETQDDFLILKKLIRFPKLQNNWGLEAHRELNRTDDLKSGYISSSPTNMPVLEGKHLVHYGYSLKNPRYYVQDPQKYSEQKAIINYKRIVWRNVSNINLGRRMFVALIPPGVSTVNSLNYISPKGSKMNSKDSEFYLSDDQLTFLTVIIGSIVAEYFIRFFSTNNNLNQYLIMNLPIPNYDNYNQIHRQIVSKFSLYSPEFNTWADKMVCLGSQSSKKRILAKKYWEMLAHLDSLVFKVYSLNHDHLDIIQQKFPNLSPHYFKKLRIKLHSCSKLSNE